MLKSEDQQFIADIIQKKSGLVLDSGKGYLLENRLLTLAKSQNFNSIHDIIKAIRLNPNGSLIEKVIEAMTTNETSFFRDITPFHILKKIIFKELIQSRTNTKELNIWCGAASSGQEPISLAILMMDEFPQLAMNWNLNFIATDISKEMLERCEKAEYSAFEMSRGLSSNQIEKYFLKSGNFWILKDNIKKMIQYKLMNLVQDLPPLLSVDLVLLRNVLIYFNSDTKKMILERIHKILKPDGYLILGGVESTAHLSNKFKKVEIENVVVFKPA